MKVNDQTRFPHPVLSRYTDDFLDKDFSVKLVITETTESARLSLDYEVSISEESISDLINGGQASAGVFVTCLDTYFNRLMPFTASSGVLEISAGQLKGRTRILPIIWSTDSINSFSSTNLHDEFGSSPWQFTKGAVLAVGEEEIISVGREKLAPMETIFSLARNEEIPEGETRVHLEGDKIEILASGRTFERIHNLRGTANGKAILLNSIYLPAVMEVLGILNSDPALFQDKRWFRIFRSKCDHLNINLSSGSILENAQGLLKSPFKRIQTIEEVSVS